MNKNEKIYGNIPGKTEEIQPYVPKRGEGHGFNIRQILRGNYSETNSQWF